MYFVESCFFFCECCTLDVAAFQIKMLTWKVVGVNTTLGLGWLACLIVTHMDVSDQDFLMQFRLFKFLDLMM